MLKTNLERIMLLLAIVLLAVGIALGMVHDPSLHDIATGLRWAAIALLTFDAWGRRSLTVWIFVAMVAGAELGFDAPAVAVNLRVLSDIFLRLIKTIVAPLILATLITGIAGHGDLKSVGRMGIKSLIYFEVATTLALVLGLVAINLSHAGVGLSMPASAPPGESVPAPAATHWQDPILHIFPENIAKSVAEGQILQVAVFAIFFGIALASLSREKRAPMLSFFSSLSEVMFKFTNIVMYFAPIGVGAAMAFTVGQMGIGILLAEGIGDTIRVSLVGEPEEEVRVAKQILASLEETPSGPNLIACPTCGRLEIDMLPMVAEVEKALKKIKRPINVSVMGCVVNGPGEGQHADIGIAGGKNKGILFKHGKIVGTFPEKELVPALLRELEAIAKEDEQKLAS